MAFGAQDCCAIDGGAYTGDISAPMLKDAGARYVIVGHSERRAGHGESDAAVRAKAEAAHRAGLTAILCVGETRAEREAGRAIAVVSGQLRGSLPAKATPADLVVAYEPVWAIGTGLTPTPADVAEMHGAIRALLERDLRRSGREDAHPLRRLGQARQRPRIARPAQRRRRAGRRRQPEGRRFPGDRSDLRVISSGRRPNAYTHLGDSAETRPAPHPASPRKRGEGRRGAFLPLSPLAGRGRVRGRGIGRRLRRDVRIR